MMDISGTPELRFELDVINGVGYRVPLIPEGSLEASLRDWKPRKVMKNPKAPAPEEDEPVSTICGVDNRFAGIFEGDDEPGLEDDSMKFQGGMWTMVYTLSHHFHKHIFGRGNKKLNELEKEYACTIRLKELDSIEILSRSKINVVKLIMHLSDRAASTKLRYTHFICIPLTGSVEVNARLLSLHSQIQDPVLRASLIPPEKLHFTLCMLKLTSEADVMRVKSIMKTFERSRDFSHAINVQLHGIQTMDSGDLTHLKVAYTGGVGDEGGWRSSILNISDRLIEMLRAENLIDVKRQRSYLSGKAATLHATILNVKYARSVLCAGGYDYADSSDDSDNENQSKSGRKEWAGPGQSKPKVKSGRGVDAQEFMQRFKDFNFGTVAANQLCLCALVENPRITMEPNGFYQTEAIFDI